MDLGLYLDSSVALLESEGYVTGKKSASRWQTEIGKPLRDQGSVIHGENSQANKQPAIGCQSLNVAWVPVPHPREH